MNQMFMKLLKQYKGIMLYIIFGLGTTTVNMIAYEITYNRTGIPNLVSTIIAWVLAVLFAFITNKLFVFDSKSFDSFTLKHEIYTFFGCRLLTGVLDVIIMLVAVDLMLLNATVWKFISNILVIVLNYIASKLVIFKKTK